MWIERQITASLGQIIDTFPVLVVVGPRQVGKTSLLERHFPDFRYVSLDAASYAEMAETRPEEFLNKFPPPVLLDEIQYAPAFFRYIKSYVDAHRNKNGLFILTGSQNFMLMNSVADSLAGRAAVVPLLGISGSEFFATPALTAAFDPKDFLWRGSYPALWAQIDRSPQRDRWYQGYLATYLERDVRNLLKVGNLRDFERFLRVCATRCGQSLNISSIGRDVGISHSTAREWLSVLQASNQIFLLEPYYRSLGKRLSKSPKLYFTDTGLAAFLMGFQSHDALWSSAQIGALWENYVIAQWLRWRDWQQPSASLWYWRDQPGNEVDLIIEINQRLVAIECKVSEKPDNRDIKGLQKLIDFYGMNHVSHAFIACTTMMPFNINDFVVAQSGWTTWKFSDA